MNELLSTRASIIILVHNHSKITLECLASVAKDTDVASCEVIIVNNGSSHKEMKILRAGLLKLQQLPTRIINLSKNMGFSKAGNIAAAKARGQFLVFLNNDTIVTKSWLTRLLAFMNQNPRVAACGPKIHSWLHQDFFDYAGGAGGFLDIFGYPFTRGRVFDFIEKDEGQYDRPSEVAWASGVCLLVRKKAFELVGGFDEYLFAYCEEIDLCLRLAQIGYKIYCVPGSLIYHWGALTSNANLFRKIFLNHHNSLYLVLKHYSLWPHFPKIVARVFLDFCAIFYYLGRWQLPFILAFLASFFRILWGIPYFVKSGVITVRGRNLGQTKGIFKGSIVLAYFFLGRKTFRGITARRREATVEHLDYRSITYFES